MHKVYLTRTDASKALYSANLRSPVGVLLVKLSRDPEYDAFRAMDAAGLSGPVAFHRKGKAHADLIIRNLRRGAKLHVVETPKHLPMLVKGSSEASEHQSSASVPQASSQ